MKKIGKMNQWKYHKETPYIATFISYKQKCHVFLTIFSLFSSRKSEESGRTPVWGGCYSGRWQKNGVGE
jgi:hypothetical protein